MDNLSTIAISKIADILSTGDILVPTAEVWEKIFCNSGLSSYYEESKDNLDVVFMNDKYTHNPLCYSELKKIFMELYDSNNIMEVLQNIIDKISIYDVFHKNINLKMNITFYMVDIVEHLKRKELTYRLKILDEYPSKEFKELRNNIRDLGFDFIFKEGEDIKLIIVAKDLFEEKLNVRLINSAF
ncbi:hypothetical protein [Clostridium intestinale]|uniref:hypothetical protein n=1 Tax=Clostridium intestinale TaxID=36845 RepID=UPI002DD68240|nr:hypothetical protein [Clostridium intestinale]WRY53089.1 hypothetical protein P8F83_07760 [Clostridium intestinale]